MSASILTQEYLKSILSYDPETGVFMWRITLGRAIIGAIAGTIDDCGYRKIMICGLYYKAHRLAWLYVYGEWPNGQIDHINGVRNDNRISNLRVVTHQENQHNQQRARGYYWNRTKRKWHTQITLNDKQRHIGYFQTESEARSAYLSAKRYYHPTSPIVAALAPALTTP